MKNKVNNSNNAIEANGISKKYRIYYERNQTIKEIFLRRKKARFEEMWALKDVSFTVSKGSTIGIIGENGSGKSTLLKILARILRPDEGFFVVNGKISALLELGAGFHPELTGRENVYLNGSILGLTQKEVDARFDDIVSFSELDKFIDTPVKNYSSGMYLRLGFAVAINVNPDVLLIDEVLAVGDELFQRKCSDKIFEFKAQGKTIVLVSHSLEAVRNICDIAIWLDEGCIQSHGEARQVVDLYLNKVNEEERRKAGHKVEQEVGSRAGSQEVEITDVGFLNNKGEKTDSFLTNEEFIVRIDYDAHKTITNPVFGIAVYRNDGIHITGPNTKISNYKIDSINGKGYIEYKVKELPLLAGTYLFTAAIFDQSCLHPYDVHDRMYSFKVLPGGTTESNGFVSIMAKWKHKVNVRREM
ncbi:MAG: ABC transporter ATP-binding protein [Actinobacteria bacterium]|nr:ABC transporter ATP-binding protein [Actinomycetota bacterium]